MKKIKISKELFESVLDLSNGRTENYFCSHNKAINSFVKESPEAMASMFIFIFVTMQTGWGRVMGVFPKVLNLLTTHSKLPTKTNDSLINSVVYGFKTNSINFVWENRKQIYSSIMGIISSNEEPSYEIYKYIVENIKGLGGATKAAFAVQLITGQYGCIDNINLKLYSTYFSRDSYNIETKNKNKAMSEYLRFLNDLKTSSLNKDSAALWNDWCDIVAFRINNSNKGSVQNLAIKIADDLDINLKSYMVSSLDSDYYDKHKNVTGNTISKDHEDLIKMINKESTETKDGLL